MVLSYLSPVRLLEFYLRRCFTGAGLSSQTISIDSDTTIHFWGPPPVPDDPTTRPDYDVGKKPALLLLHGFGPSAVWQWRHQVQAFSPASFRLYVPDLVFFGRSSTSSDHRSEVFQAECMAKLMEKVGAEKFHVTGTSYGGFVAYHMAKMWPEKVEKVVIASSGVNMRQSDNDGLLKRANRDRIEQLLLPSTAAELRTLTGLAASRRILNLFPDFFWNDFIHKLYEENRKEKVELLKGLTLGKDENLNLTPLHQEVLIIWGDEDQIFPLKMASELKEVVGPKARLEIIKSTSHIPQIERPKEFNDVVLKFLCGS